MTRDAYTLPEGFEALEPFAEKWAIANPQGRHQRRIDSGEDERAAFYDIGKDLLEPALNYLDQKSPGAFDDKEHRLMHLLLSLCHVAQAVEVQKEQEANHARLRRGLTISRASSDWQ